MNLFISDLHFGHGNIINHDHRPFADVGEMDAALIKLWNERVSHNDTVYVIGDIIFKSARDPEWYLRQLKGHKILITGNHDGAVLKNDNARKYFELITPLTAIHDQGRKIVLCHYPLAEWDGYFKNAWHIYGHIHNNTNAAYQFMKTQERALNAAACINNYAPVSFEELVENNRVFQKAQSTTPTYG